MVARGKLAEYDNLSDTSGLQAQFRPIQGTPQVFWGTCISLGVRFDGTGPDDWVEMIGGGIDFYD
jgi:hypothetical protein